VPNVGENNRKARIELLGDSELAKTPDLKWGEFLVAQLFEFGPVAFSAAGPVPVSFQEIESWSRMTNTFIPTCDAILLKQLSKDYCSELRAAENKDREAPEIPGDEIDKQARLDEGFKEIMQRFK
jgi:hypothetical protein